jgi:hypothetical protein
VGHSFALQTRIKTQPPQEIDRDRFQYAGAHAACDMRTPMFLQDDACHARLLQAEGEQKPGWACSNDRDLGFQSVSLDGMLRLRH